MLESLRDPLSPRKIHVRSRLGAAPRRLMGAFLCAGVVISGAAVDLAATALPAHASGMTWQVTNYDNDGTTGVYARNSPNTSDVNRDAAHFLSYGTSVDLLCAEFGSPVGPYSNTAWDRVRVDSGPNAGLTGHLPEHWLNTPVGSNQHVAGEPACGQSGGGGGSTTNTIGLNGVVYCHSGAVVGVWTQSSGGGSKWANWHAFSGASNVSTYSVTVTTKLPTSIQLHVGCGGTPSRWGSSNNTPNITVGGSRTINAFCSGSGSCSFPATGRTTTGNLGGRGQCTELAYNQWHAATGFWPYWTGDAGQWSTTASRYGYTVTTVPMARSIIVFPPTSTNRYGHVGWVSSLSQSSSGAVTLNILEENYDGSGDYPTGHIRARSLPASFSYRYIPAP